MFRVGVVAIGRNEGPRLERCLRSVVAGDVSAVYVDSASTDGSRELARGLGVEVVELDLSIPFTAARARNAGAARLLEIAPELDAIQFVDADCEVVDGWMTTATRTLQERPTVAVICGRRRERFPDASIYNRLIDIEWDTPVGEAKYCGGDALIRVKAFQAMGGYDPTLIAGEEPEYCVRLRHAGWKILRIDAKMTLHDAAMTRFAHWWKRSVRNGHAFAEGAARHGAPPERHWVRETMSNWVLGLIVPLTALGLAWPTWGASLSLGLIYPVQAWRIERRQLRLGRCAADARLFASFCVLSKFPQVIGQCKYWWNRLRGRRTRLIEYKGVGIDQGTAVGAGVSTSTTASG